jgi:maleylacetate reductase
MTSCGMRSCGMNSIGNFTFPGISTRVIFGQGTLGQAAPEVERLGHKKALVLSTPHQRSDAQKLHARLGLLSAGVFDGAVMHTPTDVTEQALTAFNSSGATCVVALGGGSTTGLGKAIALRTGADQIVIPTTYAGSEMTDILGETANGEKTTKRDPAIRPETVIYDVDLSLTLPVAMTVASALNAVAHGVEALYAPDRNPIIEQMCLAAFRSFAEALPVVVDDPINAEARRQILYGAWLCSTALGYVSMSLHHKLCHTLGGSFGLPHAETHAVMIPHVTAFNAGAVPQLLAPVQAIFGGSLYDFAESLGSPMSLKALGLAEADLDKAAEITTRNAYANPRTFDFNDIRALLQDAWSGHRPDT